MERKSNSHGKLTPTSIMKTTRIIMKAEDHKYPTIEERKEVIKGFPKIKYFGFSHADIGDAYSKHLKLKEISRIEHLFEWNTALINRFGKLSETYVYMMSHYNRRLNENIIDASESEKAVNRHLFQYYVEIFYYFFFSTRDIIGQLISTYYELDIPEDEIYFYSRKFKERMQKYTIIHHTISHFHSSVDPASKIRNKFTHGFTPTQRDYRPTYTEGNGMTSLELGSGDTAVSSQELIKNVNESLEALRIFMDTLVRELK